MAEQLGEILIKKGKITENQLSSVLERQVTMGGRLGTNLIELGYVSEEELTEILSRVFSIPSLKKEDLEDIDPEVIAIVPKDTARKFNVIPFRKERSTLSVALLDPQDLGMLDELRFITGCSAIRPFVTSEVRIQYALEKYYQVDRQLRYVSLLDDERKKHAEMVEGKGRAASRRDPTAPELEEALKKAKEDWVEARDRDEAIGIFLSAASVLMDRGALLVVKGKAVSAWMGFPQSVDEALKGLEIPIAETPVIKNLIAGKETYRGAAPPAVGALQNFYAGLGEEAPKEIILCPVLINDQVVSIFYGDNVPSGRPIKAAGFLQTLARKLCMVLEILILRIKILEMR